MIENYFFRPVMQQCELTVRMGEVLFRHMRGQGETPNPGPEVGWFDSTLSAKMERNIAAEISG